MMALVVLIVVIALRFDMALALATVAVARVSLQCLVGLRVDYPRFRAALMNGVSRARCIAKVSHQDRWPWVRM